MARLSVITNCFVYNLIYKHLNGYYIELDPYSIYIFDICFIIKAGFFLSVSIKKHRSSLPIFLFKYRNHIEKKFLLKRFSKIEPVPLYFILRNDLFNYLYFHSKENNILMLFVKNKCYQGIKRILNLHIYDLEEQNNRGFSVIDLAVILKDIDSLKLLLPYIPMNSHKYKRKRTALMLSAYLNYIEPTRLLIKKQRGFVDIHGRCSLIYALYNNSIDTIRFLKNDSIEQQLAINFQKPILSGKDMF